MLILEVTCWHCPPLLSQLCVLLNNCTQWPLTVTFGAQEEAGANKSQGVQDFHMDSERDPGCLSPDFSPLPAFGHADTSVQGQICRDSALRLVLELPGCSSANLEADILPSHCQPCPIPSCFVLFQPPCCTSFSEPVGSWYQNTSLVTLCLFSLSFLPCLLSELLPLWM